MTGTALELLGPVYIDIWAIIRSLCRGRYCGRRYVGQWEA